MMANLKECFESKYGTWLPFTWHVSHSHFSVPYQRYIAQSKALVKRVQKITISAMIYFYRHYGPVNVLNKYKELVLFNIELSGAYSSILATKALFPCKFLHIYIYIYVCVCVCVCAYVCVCIYMLQLNPITRRLLLLLHQSEAEPRMSVIKTITYECSGM